MKANYDRKSPFNKIQRLMKDRGKIEDLSVPELLQILSKEILLNCSEYCLESLDDIVELQCQKKDQKNIPQFKAFARMNRILDSCALQIQNALKADEQTIQLWKLIRLLFSMENSSMSPVYLYIFNKPDSIGYAFIDFRIEQMSEIIKVLNRPEILCRRLNMASYNTKKKKNFNISANNLATLEKTLKGVKEQHTDTNDIQFSKNLLSQIRNIITFNSSDTTIIKVTESELKDLKSKLIRLRCNNKNVMIHDLYGKLSFREFQLLVFIMYYNLVNRSTVVITPRDTLIAHRDYRVYKELYNSGKLCDNGLNCTYHCTGIKNDKTEDYCNSLLEITGWITEITMIVYIIARVNCGKELFGPNIIGDQIQQEADVIVQAANGHNMLLGTKTSHIETNKYEVIGI